MKILVVGVFNDNSTNNGIANGLANVDGVEKVELIDYRETAKQVGTEHRDNELKELSVCYDLAVFCKCNGVNVEVLKKCKENNCKIFLWYMDPLNGNYNDELKQKIKVADYVGVAKWEVFLDARWLNPNTHFLIEGFDPAWDYPAVSRMSLDSFVHLKQYDITFIGNPYGDRAKWLDGVTVLSNRYNIEHAKAVSQSRININLTGGGGGISDRVYKILAAKGFCLSQNYPHIEKYGLVPDEDLVLFDTPEEMVDKCNYYLAHKKERDEIAEHGYQTVQKFSRDNLAKQIVEIVSADVSPRLLRKD